MLGKLFGDPNDETGESPRAVFGVFGGNGANGARKHALNTQFSNGRIERFPALFRQKMGRDLAERESSFSAAR